MLKHSHLFYYENENSYVSNEKELDVFWLKFCKISEVHAQSDKQFKLMIQDLRLDKLLVLTFDSGLTREDWLQAILAVQETSAGDGAAPGTRAAEANAPVGWQRQMRPRAQVANRQTGLNWLD